VGTHNRELAEPVLMERPPAGGAEVFGANMMIGMCRPLNSPNNKVAVVADKICGAALSFPEPDVNACRRLCPNDFLLYLFVVSFIIYSF
jgi:hypothetical protein